jgi:spore germination protein KA
MRPLLQRLFGKKVRTTAEPAYVASTIKEVTEHLQSSIFVGDDTIVYRSFMTGDPHPRECLLVYPEGMTDSAFLSEYVVKPLSQLSLAPGLWGAKLSEFLSEQALPVSGVEERTLLAEVVDEVLTGDAALFVDGCAAAFIIRSKKLTLRPPSEPQSESVVRGPREGFGESLTVNTTLIRRRIRSPKLKFNFLQLGQQTHTKVAVAYIEGIASPAIVDEVKRRIAAIDIDGILDSGYIEELIKDEPLLPVKTIGHTERPDVVAARILEGRVAVLVDGSPVALTMPFLFTEHLQANEDYYKHFAIGSVDRLIRYTCMFISTSTPALYLALLAYHPILIPTHLAISISAARQGVPFPAVIEVFVMGLLFEIMREGGVRLPTPIGQALSIVGAIVLGDAAVQAQIVSAPMIIVVAITAISSFAVPSFYGVMILLRAFFALLAAVLGLYGYFCGLIAATVYLMSVRSFGVPYMVNFTSFDPQNIKDTAIRVPWWVMRRRPQLIGRLNPERYRKGARP